ncbi:MAG: hypothetical protein WBA16_09435, partial [Nonlabens sp.]
MNTTKFILCCFLTSLGTLVYPQYAAVTNDSLIFAEGIIKPNLISTHHFGLFMGRMEQDLKIFSNVSWTFNIEVQSGNIFHPLVQSYLPQDPSIRAQFEDITWYFRQFDYVNQQSTPAKIQQIEIDAVYKTFRPSITIPLNPRHEIKLGLRAFTTVEGNLLNSPLTGDNFIEWFHSNVAGGEDAFGRRFYGLNEVNVNYIDRDGRRLQLDNGDVILGGLELGHVFHIPIKKLNERGFYLNLTSQMSWNTSRFNKGIDLGTGVAVIKEINLHSRSSLWGSVATSFLQRDLLSSDDNVELGNTAGLLNYEIALQWSHKTLKNNLNKIVLHYQNQSPYFDRGEKDYFHLKGAWDAINQGWHHGYTTLIENTSHYTLS